MGTTRALARRITMGGLALVMAAGVFAVTPKPAMAYTCSPGHCQGYNPQTSGCGNDPNSYGVGPLSGNIMLHAYQDYGYTLVRVSPYCKTMWVKSYNDSGFDGVPARTLWIYSEITVYTPSYPNGLTTSVLDKVAAKGYSYNTYMLTVPSGSQGYARAVMCLTSACPGTPWTSWGLSGWATMQ